MNEFICRASHCNYPEGQCLGECDQIYPLIQMFESPAEHKPTFEELEVTILDDFRSTGHLLPEPVISYASDSIHIGNMVIDLILLAKNMNLDLVSCLIAARNKGIKSWLQRGKVI